MKNILKTIIKDFHTTSIESFIPRDIQIPINTSKIITLIGPRRSGKTTLLMQVMEQLINKNSISKKQILYINFEDERLQLKTSDLQLILDAFLELYPNAKFNEIYFFFDEIQEIQGWEQFVRRLYDNYSKHIYITGSSAKLLSTEIATSLRGRSISYEVFPLSFKEFLRFNSIDPKDIYSTNNKAKINNKFLSYIEYGGFPEISQLDKGLYIKTLQTYLDVMIFRDLVERYSITSTEVLKMFIRKGISNVSKEFSIHKIYNELKSQSFKISKDSLYEFSKYIEDIYLLFFLPRYQPSLKKQMSSSTKVYCIDTGLIHSNSFSFSSNDGRLLENIVFLELRRRGLEVFYHKDKKECDFIIKEGLSITTAIQVSVSLQDESTKEREIEGVLDACNYHNLERGFILTQDEEDSFTQDGIEIIVLPIWKWILE